mgnify:CR=1 FL=1
MMVRMFVKQTGDIGPYRRIVDHIEEQRIIIKDVEYSCICAVNTGHTGMGDTFFLKIAAMCSNTVQGFYKPIHNVFWQKAIQYQITIIIKESDIMLKNTY